ncbi:MAG: aminotransferase class V-fold PLP-dependent enzyme [Bacteroidia bacterium]|nr:aminotransferase class V-fold PLP-dependent enzyme [Bacteroidia bacterium]
MNEQDLSSFLDIAKDLFEEEKNQPVLSPIGLDQLHSKLDLKLSHEGLEHERFKDVLKSLILNTPRTSTNRFFNQLFGGRNSKATLGELLSVLLNSSMYTYKIGGPMIAIEREIIQNICRMAGYDESSYGTIASGGSMTNYMALIMARDHFDPNITTQGIKKNLVMYSSVESHYSIKKNAAFSGIGASNVRYIETNDKGEMLCEELEAQIKKDIEDDLHPFFINATIGTTVLGAVDPLAEISEIAKRYNLWLHADAAFYGSFLFSKKYRGVLKDLEKTDSFSMNAHKMLSTPITCSFIFTRHKECLYHSFDSSADYLYQGDEDDWNPGKISFQCGRRNDALKLWTLWKAIGTEGIERMVNNECELARIARNYIRNNENYTLYSGDKSLTICFNYRNIPADQLCQGLHKTGELMVGYGHFRDQQFVRMVAVNSGLQKNDMLEFFRRLESFADNNYF